MPPSRWPFTITLRHPDAPDLCQSKSCPVSNIRRSLASHSPDFANSIDSPKRFFGSTFFLF